MSPPVNVPPNSLPIPPYLSQSNGYELPIIQQIPTVISFIYDKAYVSIKACISSAMVQVPSGSLDCQHLCRWNLLLLLGCHRHSGPVLATDKAGLQKGGVVFPEAPNTAYTLQLKSVTPIGMTDLILSNSPHWNKFTGKKEALSTS